MLTAEEILEKWDKLMSIINDEFDGERRDNLIKLYHHFKERYLITPSSSKEYYHCAYPGGLLEHTLNVIDYSLQLYALWSTNSKFPLNFSRENVVFCALNHDLGKIGDFEDSYYKEHTDKWKKDRGELFIFNESIRWMEVADRSLWLLHMFGVKYSQSEMLGIMLHDGMYSEKNKSYLVAYTEGKQLKDYLPILIHHADMMATIIEKESYKYNKEEKEKKQNKLKDKIKLVEN